MTTKKDIGLTIKMLRKKAGIKTQERFGKKINPKPLSKETINRIENGRGNYGINALFKIAKVLDCDISEFFCSNNEDSKFIIFGGTLKDLKNKMKEL